MTTHRDGEHFDDSRSPSPGGGQVAVADSAAPTVPDEDGPRCLWGPSRCMDDLCRNSDVGLCGLRDEDFYDDENEDWDDYGDDD